MNKFGHLAITVMALMVPAVPAHAALITLTYSIEASDFQDSNGVPAPLPASSSVSGTFSFTFDDSTTGEQDNIAPLTADGFDITKSNGDLLDYNTSNTLVDFTLNQFGSGTGRVLFGATENTNDFIVGGSNDFSFEFFIDSSTYQLTSIAQSFTYVSDQFDSYVAQNHTVTLLSVSPAVVPIPASLWLFIAGFGLLARVAGNKR